MQTQVKKTHYNFLSYLSKDRWCSYWHQINEVLLTEGNDILIVGSGDGIIEKIIKTEKNVKTFDIAKDLNPTYLGSILEMNKILNKKFDTILCCQVLEHLPFEYFEKSIEQLSISSKEKVIISLPHKNFKFELKISVPKLSKKLAIIVNRFYKIHKFDGQHYWEMGAHGYSDMKIENILKKYFIIENKYFVEENSYHKFYILKRNDINDTI